MLRKIIIISLAVLAVTNCIASLKTYAAVPKDILKVQDPKIKPIKDGQDKKPPLPDLVAAYVDLRPWGGGGERPISTGANCGITGSIRNNGAEMARNVNYELLLDGRVIHSGRVDIMGGASVQVNSEFNLAFNEPGNPEVTLVVDGRGDIAESNESNNRVSRRATVQNLDDLVEVTGVEFMVNGRAVEETIVGQSGTLRVRVRNNSRQALSNVSVSGRLQDTQDQFQRLDLAPNQEQQIEFSNLSFRSPGDKLITGRASLSNNREDANPRNDWMQRGMTVRMNENREPDLVAAYVDLRPWGGGGERPISTGANCGITGSIRNNGAEMARNVNYELLLDGRVIHSGRVDIMGGASVQVNSEFNLAFNEPGNPEVTLVVDGRGDIAESNESNNRVSRRATVQNLDDLVEVTGVEFMVNGRAVEETIVGQSGTLRVRVRNNSRQALSNVSVSGRLQDTQDQFQRLDLAPNQEQQIEFSNLSFRSPGDKLITGRASLSNNREDANPRNDWMQRGMTVR
ncbi:MAG: CARDB domain-containing protein [Candidatus Omnitrophota bacterium]